MSDDQHRGLWLRNYHPSPASRVRLICLPHAGGSASYFFPFSRLIAPAVDVFAVQYPGRQDRRTEPCIDDVHELARRIFAVLPATDNRPVALFGHSMGASIGFELARLLENAGTRPMRLFASGRGAPSHTRDEQLYLADDDRLLAEIRHLSGTDAGLLDDEEMLRLVLPVIRADYRAAETYRTAAGTIAAPITALLGVEDPRVDRTEAEGWAAYTEAPFELHTFSGDHFYLNHMMPELARAVADALETDLHTLSAP
ncbi:alpha/beta fold hydrolase [Micromonospora sp. WMMD1082]|uniref:thioesterase II family protein n=1 Tax=Micromonospora sp. WMMD1082 TaxID=3016104 RepID=UPI00241697BA|nr:alpha/beta fold hydrolase [Micromonospora sp. WMMD1082]MDG4794580.1 alpha/beta fold hydrolase [Micromonospora sp. WMMD1082]